MPPPFRDFLVSHASGFSVLKIWQTQRTLPLFRGLFAPYRKMIPHASQLVSVKKENPAFACGSPVRTYFVSETPELIILPHRQLCKPPHTHAQRVSSRRKFSPFCKCAGHGRTPLPFRSFLFLIFRSERILCSGTMVDARIYACHFAVCFVQPPVPQFCLGVRYIPLAAARTAYRSGSSYFS